MIGGGAVAVFQTVNQLGTAKQICRRILDYGMTASTALPPLSSIRKPAWAARGWEVATTLRAKTGILCEG